jgi:hypothetical protein
VVYERRFGTSLDGSLDDHGRMAVDTIKPIKTRLWKVCVQASRVELCREDSRGMIVFFE